jgi:hypothetical protein
MQEDEDADDASVPFFSPGDFGEYRSPHWRLWSDGVESISGSGVSRTYIRQLRYGICNSSLSTFPSSLRTLQFSVGAFNSEEDFRKYYMSDAANRQDTNSHGVSLLLFPSQVVLNAHVIRDLIPDLSSGLLLMLRQVVLLKVLLCVRTVLKRRIALSPRIEHNTLRSWIPTPTHPTDISGHDSSAICFIGNLPLGHDSSAICFIGNLPLDHSSGAHDSSQTQRSGPMLPYYQADKPRIN